MSRKLVLRVEWNETFRTCRDPFDTKKFSNLSSEILVEWIAPYYHLAKKSGNFGLKSNGKVIFRKFRSKTVEYLQRHSFFTIRNGTTEISLPFGKFSSFQSLISRKQWREIGLQMVSAVSFGWCADFGKTFTIIQRSSQPVYSDKW